MVEVSLRASFFFMLMLEPVLVIAHGSVEPEAVARRRELGILPISSASAYIMALEAAVAIEAIEVTYSEMEVTANKLPLPVYTGDNVCVDTCGDKLYLVVFSGQ